jgi:hypothetical protein
MGRKVALGKAFGPIHDVEKLRMQVDIPGAQQAAEDYAIKHTKRVAVENESRPRLSGCTKADGNQF